MQVVELPKQGPKLLLRALYIEIKWLVCFVAKLDTEIMKVIFIFSYYLQPKYSKTKTECNTHTHIYVCVLSNTSSVSYYKTF
jgi:hypothetical protein